MHITYVIGVDNKRKATGEVNKTSTVAKPFYIDENKINVFILKTNTVSA